MSEETNWGKIVGVAIIVVATLVLALVPELLALDNVSVSLVLKGIFLGVLMSVAGYAKSENLETFDYVKMAITVITGAISGIFVYVLGWTPADVEAWFTQSGIVLWIEWLLKILFRRLKG